MNFVNRLILQLTNFLYKDVIVVKHTVPSQQEYQRTITAVNAVNMKVKYNDMGPR